MPDASQAAHALRILFQTLTEAAHALHAVADAVEQRPVWEREQAPRASPAVQAAWKQYLPRMIDANKLAREAEHWLPGCWPEGFKTHYGEPLAWTMTLSNLTAFGTGKGPNEVSADELTRTAAAVRERAAVLARLLNATCGGKEAAELPSTLHGAVSAFLPAFDAWLAKRNAPSIHILGDGYPNSAERERDAKLDALRSEAKRTGKELATTLASAGDMDAANEVRALLSDEEQPDLTERWKELRPLLDILGKGSFHCRIDDANLAPGFTANISKPGGPADFLRHAFKTTVAKLSVGEAAAKAFAPLTDAFRQYLKMVSLTHRVFLEGTGKIENANEISALWSLVKPVADAIPSAVEKGPNAWHPLLTGLSYTLEVAPPPPFAVPAAPPTPAAGTERSEGGTKQAGRGGRKPLTQSTDPKAIAKLNVYEQIRKAKADNPTWGKVELRIHFKDNRDFKIRVTEAGLLFKPNMFHAALKWITYNPPVT